MALSPSRPAEDGDDQDTHFCLRCRATIEGLDEYVLHRRAGCGPRPARPPSPPPTSPPPVDHRDEDYALNADDFFSQLELRSSAKTAVIRDAELTSALELTANPEPTAFPELAVNAELPASKASGMLTRSKTSGRSLRRSADAILAKEKSPRGRRKAPRRAIQDDDQDDDGWRHPPRSHTGGKWRPQTPCKAADDDKEIVVPDAPPPSAGGKWGPPASHTGGKWTPRAEEDEQAVVVEEAAVFPPPSHTRGKWAPGMANKVRALLAPSAPVAVRKSGSTVQYWCGSCNRRLASRKMYERHLQSDLHLRRTLPERQLDMRPGQAPVEVGHDGVLGRRRGRCQRLDRCTVCRARVLRHQLGKHLVSHFHWRSTRTTAVGSVAADLILENIEAVVRQSPFQCGLCKYYCNSSEAFRQHWASASHRAKDEQAAAADGQYWCSPCEVGAASSLAMEAHLWGEDHREVEAAVNRSVAVVVSRRTTLRCQAEGCDAAFRYNAQLTRHESRSGHRGPGGGGLSTATLSTAGDRYQCRYRCAGCGALRRSRLALQKHALKCASRAEPSYFCGVCSLDFSTASSAAMHRLGQAHRDAVRDRRQARAAGVAGRPRRRCPHCRVQCRGLAALRLHLDDKHPDKKHRCALCGMAFTLPQEVSRHHRDVHADATATTASTTTSLVPADGEQPPFACEACAFATDSKAEFVFHRVLHGPAELVQDGVGAAPRLRCPYCGRLYRKPALRTHLHVHTGERPFRCRHCDKGFSRKDSCVTHEATAHADEHRDEHLADDDDGQVRDERRLQAAISSIVEATASARSPTTPGSARATASTASRRGSVGEGRERKHLCDVCGKCFFNKATLRQHQVSLHGVKPLACSWPSCAVRARSAAELRSHLAAHAQAAAQDGGPPPPFACATCPFRCRTKQLLKRHEKIHTGEKAYKCEHCDFATRVGSHLLRHRRLHTGAKPFCCPHCSYRCNNLENLRKHVLQTNKHPGKSMYECRFCGDATFATNLASEFRGHLAREHGDVFRSTAAAASFVAGVYDKEADTAAVVVDTEALADDDPGRAKGRASRRRKSGKALGLPRGGDGGGVLDLQSDASTTLASMATVNEDQEDLPTSLLPKHALLDGDLFPLVVADPDAAQDVVYVQLEDIDGGIVVVNA